MRAWLVALFIVGVSVTSAYTPVRVPQGCLPLATEYVYAYRVREAIKPYAWSRIVKVERGWHHIGHALALFCLPSGDVWSYDTLSGSQSLHTKSHDLKVLADKLYENDHDIRSAEWID